MYKPILRKKSTHKRKIMANGGLSVFPTFSVHADPNTTSIRWKKWIDKLENLFVDIDSDKNGKRHFSVTQETKSSIFITVSPTNRKELAPPLQQRMILQYLMSMKRRKSR